MLADQTTNILAKRFVAYASKSLIRTWRRGDRPRSEWRNYHAESAMRRLIGQFIIRSSSDDAKALWQIFTDAIPQCAEEVSKTFEQLIYAEDRYNSGSVFWTLWDDTAANLLNVPGRDDLLLREHSGLSRLASVLLFDHIYWKEDARDWKPLHGHESNIAEFFAVVGRFPTVFQSLVRVLDSIANKPLLPNALLSLASHLKTSEAQGLLDDRGTLFHLARILTPIIYARTTDLRKSWNLRGATLTILDAMINAGSSAAFRMREFFITPVAPAA